MLDCEKFMACLSAHFDGELDDEILIEFEEHLRTCKEARTIVRTFERTIVLHRESRRRQIPDAVRERLMKALKDCMECDE